MNAWVLVYAAGAAHGAPLALALWRRAVNGPGNRVLAVWIALVSVDLAVRALFMADPSPALLKPYRIVALFPFLHGSLFYLYVRTLTSHRGLRLRDSIHFAGFGLALLAYADLLVLDAEGTAMLFQELARGWVPARARHVDLAMMVYAVAYVVAALLRLARYRRALLDRQSDADPAALRWLYAMAACQMLIWAIALGQWLTTWPWLSYRLIYAAVAAWVFVIGYLSLLQPPVQLPSPAEPGPERESDPDAGDIQDARTPAVVARLEQLMRDCALYREPALGIAQLARRSGYPEYLVSAVINRRYGCNFWDYVARHRIEAACARLADPQDAATVLDIAYDVGFTSKSTFNAAFKRLRGQTPSQYRRGCAAGDAATARTQQD